MGEKKFSRKGSFFSAQNWFYPISERFGSFSAIFQIFHFFESFPSFLVWKMGEKKISRKVSSAQNWFYPISERFGSFLAKIFHFFWNFFEFFGLKNGRKKFSRKGSFFSAQNWFYPISERFGAFLAIFSLLKFFIFLKFFRVFWSEKWAKKIFSKNIIFSAQNWFYPISERFGAFFKIFKTFFGNFSNFSFFFLKFFRVFWSEKWAKKNFSKNVIF